MKKKKMVFGTTPLLKVRLSRGSGGGARLPCRRMQPWSLCWRSIDPTGRKGKFKKKKVSENLKNKARAALKVIYKVISFFKNYLENEFCQTVRK